MNSIDRPLCTLLLGGMLLTACGDPNNPSQSQRSPDPSPDAGAVATPVPNGPWRVYLASERSDDPYRLTAEETVGLLEQMGGAAALTEAPADGVIRCVDGELRVTLGTALPESSSDQAWRIEETFCGDGRLVSISGGGLLGHQYGAYAWLHTLGVRFFHPEQTFVPEVPLWGEVPLEIEHTPAFQYRSVSLHLTHPLELGDPINADRVEYLDEVKRYIDWGVRNFASDGLRGKAGTELEGYGLMRGFPKATGFNLHEAQQGGKACIDPADDRSMEAQLTDCIESRMTLHPDAKVFNITFNESEFPRTDGDADLKAVAELTFVAEYMAENYPHIDLYTIYHGTRTPLTENHMLPFFELPRLAPKNLGVKVHTLMFYDLQRPAPVYGNDDFSHMLDFMEEEAATRRLWHFPEAAWWLTFDIAVPLYLPVTVEARSLDLDLIEPLRSEDPEGNGVVGHRVFGTGHEWGYWQNEYCSYRMSADPAYRWQDCFADITGIFGEAGTEAQAVLEEMVAAQIRDFIYDADLLAYLVGTDPETEAAYAAGIVFHPLPPAPGEILRWSEAEIDQWLGAGEMPGIADRLGRIAEEQSAWVARLRAVADQVPESARPWFDEIIDGVEINGLRAQHQHDAYGALVLTRLGRLTGDAALEAEGAALLESARTVTEQALAVIRRRAESYRYAPVERAIGGGPTLDADDNWTVYDYRYLARTHHGYYYTRIDDLVTEALEAPTDGPLEIVNALLDVDEPLQLRRTDAEQVDVPLALGDGTVQTGEVEIEHTYAAPGLYTLTLGDAETPDATVRVAQTTGARRTPHDGGFDAEVLSPAGVNTFIRNVLPGVVLGTVDDQTVALGFTLIPEGHVQPEWLFPVSPGDAALVRADQVLVPVVSRGEALAGLALFGFTLSETDDGLLLVGELDKDQVVAAVGVVSNGALSEEDVQRLLPPLVGYPDFEAVPQRLPVEIVWPALEPR
ncbi:MAG: hypothetical protein ACE366_02485 [Bradymonadia bacterium]